jgi:DNA-binding protein H-NS
MDLQSLSLDELKALRKDVAKAIDSFEDRQRKAALAEVEAVAARHGYSLDALTGKKRSKAVHPPRYQHPEDSAQTWSGRGRQPQWIKDALASGRSLEEFAIEKK